MINYVTETELKGYIPELAKYLWTGETVFTAQKGQAERDVLSDLVNKGYLIRQLQPQLALDVSGDEEATEDNINALRFVCVADSAGTIELLGANTNDDDTVWTSITTLTFTAGNYATLQSYQIVTPYKFYYVETTETLYNAYLVELTFDRLFAYKWLELIMMDAFKEENDAYFLRMIYFRDKYNDLLSTMTINVDTDDSGDITEDEQDSANSITYSR